MLRPALSKYYIRAGMYAAFAAIGMSYDEHKKHLIAYLR